MCFFHWVWGWLVGWVRNAGNKANLSPASAGTWAELGNNSICYFQNILPSLAQVSAEAGLRLALFPAFLSQPPTHLTDQNSLAQCENSYKTRSNIKEVLGKFLVSF